MSHFRLGIVLIVAFFLFSGLLLFRMFRRRAMGGDAANRDRIQQQVGLLPLDLRNIPEELARKKEIADKLPVIVSMLSANLSMNAIPRVVVRTAKELFCASKVGYFELTGDSSELTLKDCSGYPPDLMHRVRLHKDEGILGKALRKREVVSKHDPFVPAETGRDGSSLESYGMEFDIVAPIFVNSTNMGVLVLGGCGIDIESERKYVAMLADLAGGALRNAMKSDLLKAASFDDLTGLYNRRFFMEWFEAELRRAKSYLIPISLFMFDIDCFKAVNDTHGHHAGDLVLKKLGYVIRRHTRSSDIVARYGGEEFVAAITCADKGKALHYANGMREIIAATKISIPDVEDPISVTISGGVSSFPVDGESATDLIHAADQALYGAKREKRNEVFLANDAS